MRQCGNCYGLGRIGFDVTPGRRGGEVTCRVCSGTGWHKDYVFKDNGKLTAKAIWFLVLKLWFGLGMANIIFEKIGGVYRAIIRLSLRALRGKIFLF